MTRRHGYHHGDLRPALLRAALELLDAEGPEGVTIRAVARRASVSHAAPANHFADRGELLTALATTLFQDLDTRIARALARGARPPVERVRAFADALLRFGLAAPNRYRLLWRRDLLDLRDAALASAMDAIYDRLVAELAALPGRRPHGPDTYAIALWSLVHGYLSMRIDGTFVARTDPVSGVPRERAIVDALLGAPPG